MDVPATKIHGEETADGVAVTDVTFDGGEIGDTEAYLVAPSDGGSGPAVLWFRWLEGGSPTSNRTEFLEEARGYAPRGVTSLLRTYDAGHELDAVARADRETWLSQRFGLEPGA